MGVFPHELKKEIETRRISQSDAGTKRMPEDDFVEVAGIPDKNPCLEPEDLKCMLCIMLWDSEDLSSKLSPKDLVPFVKDEILQNMVSALLSGETPRQLEERWRQLGDRRSLELIARGNGIIAREGIDADKAESIAETIRRRCVEERVRSLNTKLKKGIASESEVQEHLKLTRILKGGKFGT